MSFNHTVFWTDGRTSKHQDSADGCCKRLALLRHEVGYQLRMQSQYIWWVGVIVPLVKLSATAIYASWLVAVLVWF